VCHGTDDPPEASRTLEGQKTQFPAKTIADGVTATVGVLQFCHYSDTETDTVADMKKAQEKDHVRLFFPRPIKYAGHHAAAQ